MVQKYLNKVFEKYKTSGCRHCANLERVFRGEGKRVGVSEYNQDIYFLES